MAGIGVIINPNSRMNRRYPERIQKLGYILGDRGSCELTKNVDDIYRVAEGFKAQGIEILALSGGDGTNHVTLTKFFEVYGDTPIPKIALLRGGTMNTIANGVGVKGDSFSLLSNLVEKYHRGEQFETTQRDILNVNGNYGFIFGNGLIHSFLTEYYATNKPSPLRALTTLSRGTISALWGGEMAQRIFRKFKGEVIIDGKKAPYEEYSAVIAATVEQVGLGFAPFYRCEEQPGTFHIYLILCSAAEFAMQLPKFYAGKPPRADLAPEFVAKEVVFSSRTPLLYQIDGDTYKGPKTFTMTCGPRLTFIVR
ncbi:MAG: hypothetical protein Kow0090_20800 [Myxococcota bacterium]